MMLIDDLILAPAKGVLALSREIARAAQEERAGTAQQVQQRLRELYLLLEAGGIDEAGFQAAEQELLDQLDELAGWASSAGRE